MYNTVFISHSKDDPHLDFFHSLFSGLHTKAVWMEFEHIEPPAYQYIKNHVNQSDALFVLLSDVLLKKSYTASWISFEIGLAANWRSEYLIERMVQDRIDVYVFEPLQQSIDYAIPYCTYYMPYDGRDETRRFLRELVENAPYHNKGTPIRCPYSDCGIEFKLLSDVTELKCPTCRRGMTLGTTTQL